VLKLHYAKVGFLWLCIVKIGTFIRDGRGGKEDGKCGMEDGRYGMEDVRWMREG